MADVKSFVRYTLSRAERLGITAAGGDRNRILTVDLKGYPQDFPMIGEKAQRTTDRMNCVVVSTPFKNNSDSWAVAVSKGKYSYYALVRINELVWGNTLTPKTQTYTIAVEVQATSQAEAESLVSVKRDES